MWIQSEDGFLIVFTNDMFIVEIMRTKLVIADGVSLVVSELIEWVLFDDSVVRTKFLLRLGSKIRIWLGAKIGNDYGLSHRRSGGKSYGKRLGWVFGRYFGVILKSVPNLFLFWIYSRWNIQKSCWLQYFILRACSNFLCMSCILLALRWVKYCIFALFQRH